LKKRRYVLFAVLVIVMLIQLDVKLAVDHPDTPNLSSDGLVGIEDPLRLLRKVIADTAAPRTPTDLKELVLDLLEATPLANRTDYDGDGLYDPVEAVIGTDPESNDTDADDLSDYDEVMNGTDPILPDSNYDGLFDDDEVSVELDLDDDGIPNAWDFDNDGDGVNDRSDLSPYAKSVVSTSFNISIQSTGSPTYITFQVVPENPEHLRLLYQTWDWLNYDSEGQMQDIDGSKNDLELVPYLHLKTRAIPVQSDLDAFGVLAVGDGISIPLSPVYEFENIVAFSGRLLYNESTPLDIDLEAELVWQVVGYTDATAYILKANGNYVSVGQNTIAVANVSDESYAAVLEWIILKETSDITTVAIKLMGGPYLSVAEDNRTLEFNGTSIGQRETFQLLKLQGWLMGYNGNFTSVLPDGTMTLTVYERAVFSVIDTVHTSPTALVRYDEPFMLTGFTVEEFHGTDVGILYNVTSKNQTIAAQWLMNYRFVNNATTTLSDMPSLLQGYNVNVSCRGQSVTSKYQALVVLSENLIPDALGLRSSDEAMPIIIAIEDNTTIVDMSEVSAGSWILNGPCTVDLTAKAMQTSKSLKMNWYNSSTFIGLCPAEIVAEVITWGEDPVTSYNLITVLLRWNTGEYRITKQQLVPLELDDFDTSELDLVSNIAMAGLSILELGGTYVSLLKNWRHLKWLQGGEVPATMREITDYLARWSQGLWGKSNLVKSIGQDSKILAFCKYQDSLSRGSRSGRFAKFFKMFDDAMFVIGVVVEVGLSIAAGVMIADQIGGSAGREFGVPYALLALVVGLWIMGTEAIIATIPVIGWLIALGIGIADACGNYSQGMIAYIVSQLYGRANSFAFVTPDAYVKEVPTISVLDYDNNGVDLGDTILVNGTLWSEIDVAILFASKMTEFFETDLYTLFAKMTNPEWHCYGDINFNLPYVDIIGPEGSNTGMSVTSYTDPLFVWRLLNAYLYGGLSILNSEDGTYVKSIREGGTWWPWRHYWVAREYPFSAWITPGSAQPNFPIVTRMTSTYKVSNFWWHCPVWLFGAECLHRDWFINYTRYNIVTDYYDVLPGSLADFLVWKWISANDYDGDGLNKTEELYYGTFWTECDSDADGLDDGYEIEHGYDPRAYDTDSDGVTDWFENTYETNVTDTDSDGDGLTDYQEISGWVISFDYLDNISLPFQMRVTSDPSINDTDDDGIGDLTEYKCNTNPRSKDTDGDRIEDDVTTEKTISIGNYETSRDVTQYGWVWDSEANHPQSATTMARVVDDIAVDAYGCLYTTSFYDDYYDEIRKFYPNLTEVVLPDTSYFTQGDSWAIDGCVFGLEVDSANDWLYAWTYNYNYTLSFLRFSLDGSVLNPGSYTPLSYAVTPAHTEPDLIASVPSVMSDLDLSSAGNIFTTWYVGIPTEMGQPWDYGPVEVYNRSGALLDTWGTWLPWPPAELLPEKFDNPVTIAVDSENGYVYVGERAEPYMFNYSRVAKFRMADGAYISALPMDFLSIEDIDVDPEGFLYVLGNTTEGPCLRKFNRDGFEDEGFVLYGNATANFTKPIAVTVDPNHNIFILDTVERNSVPLNPSSVSRVWKFSQEVYFVSDLPPDTNPDWDNDGLNNTEEFDGWDITVNFTSGEFAFRVTSSPLMNDSDQDGLGDFVEFALGSNPNSPDTDLDGVSDHKEWWLFTYPGVAYVPPTPSCSASLSTLHTNYMNWQAAGASLTDWDTDGDLLRDGIELAFGSSPVSPDSDGDGLSDIMEFLYNSDPNSADTDNDGADDDQELYGNSSLLSADSDNDFMFDGAEYDQGTNATDIDYDADDIPDGYELLYGTDPVDDDSDGDNISDSMELTLGLDPRSNDTDGDGIDDGTELSIGSNPWNEDSDYDGIPDSEDTDTYAKWEGPVILVLDPDALNETLDFATTLADYVEVIVVSVDELLENYSDASYVVLIGRPDPNGSSVEGLVYDLLVDTGDVLTDMLDEESRNMAIRYGVWTDTQTVTMLSSAIPEDVFLVLQILRGKNVTVLADSVHIEYQRLDALHNGTIAYAIVVNEIDSLRAIDSVLSLYLSGGARLSMQISRYNTTTTPHVLTYATGLRGSEVSLGVYLDVSVTLYENTTDALEATLVQIYYRESDLDQNGDGVIGKIGDINETSLCLYWYDETSSSWIRLTSDLEWVIGSGLNTTDVEIYGESYAGYVWANVTRLSLFGLAGELISVEVPLAYYAVATIAASAAVVGVLFAYRRKKQFLGGTETETSLDPQPKKEDGG